jgi:hypothetical protein
MSLPISIAQPETRPTAVTFNTSEDNVKWLVGLEEETQLSRSLLMHRILTQFREQVGIATIEGERRQGERRSA